MHIPDWDPKFLSRFDPTEYVRNLVRARAQSIVCYAQSHVGLFNYPTKVGEQHRAWKGRNILEELIQRCHEAGIAVVIYTSLIHDRWAFDHHPEWRMKMADGNEFGRNSRYGVVCPNSPYREYVRAWTEEICHQFNFEGIRFDMTFWVGVCYCSHCQKRFADEIGGEMPKVVNWLDERWVALQRKREQWLGEFAAIPTSAVRRLKPEATVEHQASTYPLNWTFGVGTPLLAQNDFLQGDFYGDALQGSFVRKLLEDLTPHRPYGFETSFSVDLHDHTAAKSEALLETKASAAIADHAAFVFIDGIDPIGTLNPRHYERMGNIFGRLEPFYSELGGRRVRDIGIYYSLESKCDFKSNGKPVLQAGRTDSHTDSAVQVARRLLANHLPYGIVTSPAQEKLADLKALILAGVNMMDPNEAEAIGEWVKKGGCILVTGGTSLVDKRGRRQPDFLLSDALGVSLKKADWNDREHYIAPTTDGSQLFDEFDETYPAFCQLYGFEVAARTNTKVLATTTLPWPAPDPTKFSSIHSNPPWQPTSNPEITLHEFGKGKAIYCSSPIERMDSLAETFVRLLRLMRDEFTLQAEAPSAVEFTLFHQPDRQRYLLSAVNFQKDLPNLPVENITVRLQLPKASVQSITDIRTKKSVPFAAGRGKTSFTIGRLETLVALAINVQ